MPFPPQHRPAALVAVVALLSVATPAFAHRLDEYLQATTITLSRDAIELRLRLTAGVRAASQVLAAIDVNGDGRLSDAEQRAYAAHVERDLTLSIDGTRPITSFDLVRLSGRSADARWIGRHRVDLHN
jgi:hypothetical protein